MVTPLEVARAFRLEGRPVTSAPLRLGHIHESLVLTCEGRAGPHRYLLQRLNARVFPDPAPVMENIARVTAHLAAQLERERVPDRARRVLSLVPTHDDATYWDGGAAGCWRAYRFIEGARSLDRRPGVRAAYHAAWAFGEFGRRLGDLPAPPLHTTLPGFHDTPGRLAALARALERDALNRAAGARELIDAVLLRAPDAHALADLQRAGRVPVRVVHNDTKLSNVLVDRAGSEPLCVVDLDTVMPGLVAHDFGDLVRSAAATAAEDERDLRRMGVDLGLIEALARGYLAGWAGQLRAAEVESLAVGPRVITLELAARFLTDYLEGDRYFRTERPGQNLDRCRAQLALLEALERRAEDLRDCLERAARG